MMMAVNARYLATDKQRAYLKRLLREALAARIGSAWPDTQIKGEGGMSPLQFFALGAIIGLTVAGILTLMYQGAMP